MMENPDAYCEQLCKRYDALKADTERTNWESHCEEISQLVSPRKLGFTGERTAGEKKMTKIYDATGVHANEMLAAGLHGMATNPASRWFSLRMKDDKIGEQDDIRGYLSDVEEKMFSAIYSPFSNFNTAIHEAYLDLGAFGQAVMFVGTRKDGGLLFQTRHLAECVISENDEGVVDTLFRRSKYTVRQMVHLWGIEGVSQVVREKFQQEKLDEQFDVLHAVLPREKTEYGKKNKQNHPFASIYFEHKTKHMLEESGFEEFPYLVPRWAKLPGEMYGRGPGMTALPDVKMLQAQMITFIKALQKNADPPLWTRDDGILGGIRTVPGGVNYVKGDARAAVSMMPTSLAGLQAVEQAMEGLRERIRTLFFTNIMQFGGEAPDMTATEVQIRNAEKLRMMGPLIGRLESEMLGPMVSRVYGIMERLGMLPEPPDLGDIPDEQREWVVEFVSPIATAQRQTQLEGVQQAIMAVMGLGEEAAAAIIKRKLNPDRMFDWVWDLLNNDPDLLNTDEELEEIDNMQRAQQGLAMAGPAADMAQKGAGALQQLAGVQQQTGMDPMQMLQGAQQGIAGDPRAQEAVGAMGEGMGMDLGAILNGQGA